MQYAFFSDSQYSGRWKKYLYDVVEREVDREPGGLGVSAGPAIG